MKNLHAVAQSGCASLYSDQQCKIVPFSLHPYWHLLSLVFLIVAILTGGGGRSLIVVEICISLMTSAAEHRYVLEASVDLLWQNTCSDSLPILKLGYFLLLLTCMSYLYVLNINPLSDM